jgi:hypothetical protein
LLAKDTHLPIQKGKNNSFKNLENISEKRKAAVIPPWGHPHQ